MINIRLNDNDWTLIDDEDYKLMVQYNWCIRRAKSGLKYVQGGIKGRKITFHRYIMKVKRNQQIDHVNGNGLDNRRSNLRISTQQENCFNRRKASNNTSGYKGVVWNKKGKKWQSRIKMNGKRIYLGLYENKKKAAVAYNLAAKILFGEFAHINYI